MYHILSKYSPFEVGKINNKAHKSKQFLFHLKSSKLFLTVQIEGEQQ